MSARSNEELRDADLWYVRPERVADRPAQLAAYRELLPHLELRKMARYLFERDRLTHLVARALIRTTLSRYRPAVEPAAWRFADGEHGKPYVTGPGAGAPFPRFNLTHTAGLVALLVTADREVGLDAEDATRVGRHLDDPEHFFAPDELDPLARLAGDAYRRRFYELWTLKEAYIKARGLGLALPLDRFALGIEAEGPTIRFAPPIIDRPERWQLWSARLGPRHQLAVAIDRGERTAEDDLAINLRETVPLSATT